jgi:phage/plasmid-like protein (TIGR03299 family)
MAHELEMVNGKAQMAWVGDVPWHSLGTKVDDNLSANEMLIAAGLDWTVDKLPQFVEIDGKKIETGQKALVRSSDNSILTYVSDGWNPVQNHEAFDFFHDFVEMGKMKMHTAGSLKMGKRVWGLAKIEEDFEILGRDKIESYLLFSNPHEYGRGIDVRLTNTRVVCQNTLSLALEGKNETMIKLNHSRKFDAEAVKKTLGMAHNKTQEYKEAAEFLSSKRYTNDTARAYLDELFPKSADKKLPESLTSLLNVNETLSRTAQKVFDVIETQPGANLGEGSYWQLLNAVTYFTNHMAGRNLDNRASSLLYGVNRDKNIQALNKAVAFANAA